MLKARWPKTLDHYTLSIEDTNNGAATLYCGSLRSRSHNTVTDREGCDNMPDSLGLDTSVIPNWIKTLRHEEDHQALMILELAAELADAPIAMINLRDGGQLKRWLSLDDNVHESIPINDALCGMAVMQASPLITCDARQQSELARCSSVFADGIRYYIGLPLKADNGEIIGCMSLADSEPRQQLPSSEILVRLNKLALLATEALKRQINQSHLNAEFEDSQSRASWILRSISDGILEWKTGNERLTISTRLARMLHRAGQTLPDLRLGEDIGATGLRLAIS